jgi:hypothetical protein
MTTRFITIREATELTGKSRRTMQRLVEKLVQEQSDQVMKEKTAHGYIWRISEQSVRAAYGVTASQATTISSEKHQPVPASAALPAQLEKYMDVARQGYTGMMTMHEEVKQAYEARLKEKDGKIAELTQELMQARKGFWTRLLGS